MKKITIGLVLTLAWLHAFAQWKTIDIGPYGEIAIPVGLFARDFKVGFGGGITTDIRLIKKWAATASVGYMELKGQVTSGFSGRYIVPNLGTIPLRGGVKYRVTSQFYAKLEAGWAAYTSKSSGPFISYYDGGTPLLSPGIGLRIKGFDVQAKYEVWTRDFANQLTGIKMGWNF